VAPLQVLTRFRTAPPRRPTATFFYMGDPTFAFGTSIPFGLNTRQMLSDAGGLNC
jgi:TRAP-type mannitol/chloroaromatic compound transport system substrate-binding protein